MSNDNTNFTTTLGYSPAPESASEAFAWLKSHGNQFDHFIGGKWVPSESGATFDTTNPATGEVLAKVAVGTSKDVDTAVAAAQEAFPLWRKLSGFVRAMYLYAFARAIAKHARILAVLESLDNGKTLREARDIDLPAAIRHIYAHAGWAMLMEDEFPGMQPGGVIAQIIPWNFPLLMLAWKIAPAIAAGNTVVLKPAETTPLTALYIAELLKNEVKLPPGVVNIVTGDGSTGQALVEHPTPWMIAFTGSTEVGRIIRKKTAGTGKRLGMELGGKSPFIVFPDADIDSAIEGVVDAIWFNQGEVCCAGSRLLLHESIAEQFVERLKYRMQQLRVGDPLDKTMDMGAINSRAQYEKILRLIELGKAQGAVCYQPEGRECPTGGFFVPPTLFTGVQPSHSIAQEEIFGPVAVVMTFRTPAEAVALANNTRYGLAASVWTSDAAVMLDVDRQLKAGTVWNNCTNQFDPNAPFGGYRESGFGREGGDEGIMEVLIESDCERERSPESVELQPAEEPSAATPLAIDRTFRFLVGGKLVRPDGGNSYQARDMNGVLTSVVSDANRKDVRNAVDAARAAQANWGDQSGHARAQILYFLAENLAANVGRLEASLCGTYMTPAEAQLEVKASLECLFYWAALADKRGGGVKEVPGRFVVTTHYEPIGVIGLRAPDEHPLLGFVSIMAAAISRGNTVVIVAGEFPLPALELLQVIQNSDVPAGVVNILTSSNPDAIAEMLANHMDVDAVWFFGSAESSAKIEALSACNMKRTLVSRGRYVNWSGHRETGRRFLHEAIQVKTVWIPFGA